MGESALDGEYRTAEDHVVLALRVLVVPVLVGLAFASVSLVSSVGAQGTEARVVIVDNDGPTPNQGIDMRTGEWGFAPAHIAVTQGEPVMFENPEGNFRPHDVVSITRSGSSAEPVLESGARFGSGTTQESWIRPGGSWTLDTSGLDPGYYAYYCSVHPWMVGNVTVLPQPTQ